MASSLFGGSSNPQGFVNTLRQMVGGDPDAALSRMMQANPQFAEFVQRNRGKTPDQIAADYGIDIGPFRRFM